MKLLAAVLGIGIACAGQQPAQISSGAGDAVPQGRSAVAGTAPDSKLLKCGKYEHVDHWPGGCGPSPCDEHGCYAVCLPPPPDKCAPDLHVVTEREWQDLKDHIRTLERLICTDGHGVLHQCPPKQ